MRDIEGLRKHLFAALEGLTDETKPMDIERAKAVADVAQVVINSAKVEVDFMRVSGATQGSGFLPHKPRQGERMLEHAAGAGK